MFENNVAKIIGFSNIAKTNVAKTNDSTTVPQQMFLKQLLYNLETPQLLTTLTFDLSKNNVAGTNDFSNIVFVNVVEPLVLATLFSNMLYNQCF